MYYYYYYHCYCGTYNPIIDVLLLLLLNVVGLHIIDVLLLYTGTGSKSGDTCNQKREFFKEELKRLKTSLDKEKSKIKPPPK